MRWRENKNNRKRKKKLMWIIRKLKINLRGSR